MNSQLVNIINGLLSQKNMNLSETNLLEILSLIALMKIIDLEEQQATVSRTKIEPHQAPVSSQSSKINNINQLLGQLSSGNENNLQQLLPLLLQTLNNNQNTSKQNFNDSTSNQNQTNSEQQKQPDKEKDSTQNEKKKSFE
ncbi:MAG: hypothetical protein ACOCQ1_02405 [Halanaerobiaceae bacterium]